MIKNIYEKWLDKYPWLEKEKYVTLLVEGLGSYKGKPNSYAQKYNLHPLGRMGAQLGIFKNGELIYSTKNASTLPDIPMDPYGRFNDGTPTPTACIGIYPLYTKMHGKKNPYPAFELGLGGEKIPVIRNSKKCVEYKHFSSGINFHYGSGNDGDIWANSTGCQITSKEDFNNIVKILGCWKNGRYVQAVYAGMFIIDRSMINENIQERYKQRYGKYYNDCFNTFESKPITSNTEDISSWAQKSWEKAKENNINDGKGAKNNVTEEQLMVFFDRFEDHIVKKYNLEKLL
ncbi:hypothetical protein [Vallitalea guaymasensis]|uniref:hypothetical protein n=1 Tax=Vallitalea guaymasensis TaxID=1185412 RepID=UPI000DE2E9F3|nr:hypothetical protein [Vallitalea guaymasensis]